MIYTFYSYKGGVGRSMAMAAVAYLFAQRGLKVLAIDFDLEAPGLERYFFESDQARVLRERPGLMDLLATYKKAMTSEAEFREGRFRRWWDFVDEAVPSVAGGGRIDILTAGRREPEDKLREYALAVRTFDWQDFFANWNGEQFFDWLRRQLLDDSEDAQYPGYDIVLVDSRTGVTEMGGVSAYQLADCMVLLCAANLQNLEGTLAIARDFRSDPVIALRRGRPLEMVVMPARLEANNAKREEFFERLYEAIPPAEYFPPVLAEAGLDYEELALPYEPEFAVIERLVGDGEGAGGSQTTRQMLQSFERMADALTLLASRPGKLASQKTEALARLRGEEPRSPLLEQVADPTQRSAGFDVYIDASRTDQAFALELADELQKRGLRVVNAEGPNFLASLNYETLVLCFGAGGASEFAPRLVAVVRERKQGMPAILPVLLAAPDDPCPSGHAAARALELEDQLLRLDPRSADLAEKVLAAIRKLRPRTATSTPPPIERDPYPGARPFTEDEASFFFCREQEIDELFGKIRDYRVTFLVGPAGVGKTSLVTAGLLPRWRQQWRDQGERHRYFDCALTEPHKLARIGDELNGSLLILDHVDSFPRNGSAVARKERILAVGHVVNRARYSKVLMIWRGTFDTEERRILLERFGLCTFFELQPLVPLALLEAIERPAGRNRHLLEHGLAQLIVENAGRNPSAIAQIQRLMPILWQDRKRGWLTTSAYNRAGGVVGVFSRFFAELYTTLSERERRAVDTLLRSLVYFDGNMQLQADFGDWKDLHTLPDLENIDAIALRDLLAEKNLIHLACSSASIDFEGVLRVGMIFPKPGAYGKEYDTTPDPPFLLWRQRFASQLAGWRQNRRAADYLLSGLALSEAEEFAKKYMRILSRVERQYIGESAKFRALKEAERQQAEFNRISAELAQAEVTRAREAEEIALRKLADMTVAERKANRVSGILLTLVILLLIGIAWLIQLYRDAPTLSKTQMSQPDSSPRSSR